MDDLALANEIIDRLNKLIQNPEASELISKLVNARIEVPESLVDHPTIQVHNQPGQKPQVGFLGLLNGIVGVREDQWGYITLGEYIDGSIEKFKITETIKT